MRKLFAFVLISLALTSSLSGQSAEGPVIQIKGNMIENLSGSFSGTFQGAPVAEVFRTLSSQTGLNIMVSPRVNQTVTAKFKDVLIKDAFLAILSANDLYYVEQGNIVKIMTLPEYRTELQRNHLQTKTYDASIIDIKNLPGMLQPILTPGVGSFAVDSQSSKIVVTDVKDNMPRVDALFRDIASLPPMVEIETKILEVTLEDGNSFGINWEALNLGNAVNISMSMVPSGGLAEAALNIRGSYLDPGSGISVEGLISALSKKYQTKLVSQPRVLAMNRETAKILIGSKVPYIKSIIENAVTSQQTSQIDFIDTGVKMEVQPLITPDGEVKLNIKSSISSYKFISITTKENAPEITTTEVNCDTVAVNNRSILIGGLIRSTVTKDVKAIPILGHIPLLGFLFSYNSETVKREEIVIILSPRVVRGGQSNIPIRASTSELMRETGTTTNEYRNSLTNTLIRPTDLTNEDVRFSR